MSLIKLHYVNGQMSEPPRGKETELSNWSYKVAEYVEMRWG